MLQEMPESTLIAELSKELTENMALDPEKVNLFQAYIQDRHNVATTGDLQKLRVTDFNSATKAATLSTPEALAICICLGCAQCPYKFQPAVPVINDDGDDNTSDDEPLSTWVNKPPYAQGLHGMAAREDAILKAPKEKGGTMKMSAQMLTMRRERLDPMAYHLPRQFQVEMKDSPLRNEDRLRKKIIVEVETVCGDLYPSGEERNIILGKVLKDCGPPTTTRAPHWDNWKDGDNRRHKGTSIGDLEKARGDPSKFGVTGKAFHGMMRPARPFVPRQGASVLEPVGHGGFGGPAPITPAPAIPSPEVPGGSAPDRHDEFYGDADFEDLESEKHLQEKVKALEAELQRVKAVEEAKKTEKEQAKKAVQEKKAAEKKRKAAEAAANAGNPKDKENSIPKGTRRRQEAEPTPQSDYENARDATMAKNQAYLALAGKAAAANLEIMDESTVSLLHDKDGMASR